MAHSKRAEGTEDRKLFRSGCISYYKLLVLVCAALLNEECLYEPVKQV